VPSHEAPELNISRNANAAQVSFRLFHSLFRPIANVSLELRELIQEQAAMETVYVLKRDIAV
jgi:hypothetical protein